MPACVPLNNNNVGDVNANAKPPDQHESKLSKIISCLFLKKKTDVVNMTKEPSGSVKKQTMSVDRSERSRRVLKMESMRTVPKSRDESDPQSTVVQSQNQMFLPSESPQASFLSYMNPSVRRACSEMIRTTSAPNSRNVREAFTDSKRKVTRNTNYRGQQSLESNGKAGFKKPPRPPERKGSRETRQPVIVPGIMTSSDDDIGYDSDNEISDLQDEMRRMNLSQPDLRSKGSNGKQRRREGSSKEDNLTDEGSISLSEGSDIDPDDKTTEDRDRPQNPAPGATRDQSVTNERQGDKKSMEEVIDNLYQQTQQNIDTIYKNGLEKMDLETYRSDTMTPDTCMKRLEEDLLASQPDVQATPDDDPDKAVKMNKDRTENVAPSKYNETSVNNPHLDNLLTEVSIWAQDRQKWLLEGKETLAQGGQEDSTREGTLASMTTDGRAIDAVTMSNKEKCNEWVNDTPKPEERRNNESSKTSGILSGPKLFRSSSRGGFNETSSYDAPKPSNEGDKSLLTKLPTKKSYHAIQLVDIGQEAGNDLKEVPGLDLIGPYPEPWTADMYTSTPRGDNLERSTINDNLSELDDRHPFRARSPDSWLSSAGSCSNIMNRTSGSHADPNHGFEPSPTPSHGRRQMLDPVKINAFDTASKSHQILRQAPKIHAPFRGLDRQITPMSIEPSPIPTKPLLKNTQLKPLTVLRSVKQQPVVDNFPTLPGMKQFTYQGMRHIKEDTGPLAMRPFSEIPLRPEMRNDDRNSIILGHSTSVREAGKPKEAYTHAHLSQSSSVRETRDPPYSFANTAIRPYSETVPMKRSDKVGLGLVMATKENHHYVRDVLHSVEKNRPQPQQDAFHRLEPNAPLQQQQQHEPIRLEEQNDPKEVEPVKKRHKVFTNSLIKGGYNYDKHSRHNTVKSEKENRADESKRFLDTAKFSVKNTDQGTTSVTDLSFSLGDNAESPLPSRPKPNFTTEHHVLSTTTFKDGPNGVNIARGKTSQSFNLNNTPNADTKRGNTTQSFNNKYSATQSHGLGIPPSTFVDKLNLNQAQTADKFRKIRSRRDQEMEWLMRDAAETEV